MIPLEFDWSVSTSLLVSFAVMIFTYFRTRSRGVDERFTAGSKRMDAHEMRLGSIEQRMDALPGKDDLHRLQLSMVEMAGEMKAMSAAARSQTDLLRGLQATINRHEDHLLGQGK